MAARLGPRIAIVVVQLGLAWYTADAADVAATWNGGFNQAWSDASQWDTNPDVPNNGASTYDVVLNSGSINSNLAGTTIDGLFFNNGRIAGTEPIDLLVEGLWQEGTFATSGGLTIGSDANFTISGSGAKRLEVTVLTVEGSLLLTGSGELQTFTANPAGARINITSGGTFDIQSDADLTDSFADSPTVDLFGSIENAGRFVKSAGSGESYLASDWTFLNTGELAVESGTLRFSRRGAGFSNEGVANVSAGQLTISGGMSTGDFSIQSGGTLSVQTSVSFHQVFDGAEITNDGALSFGSASVPGNAEFIGGALVTGAGATLFHSGTISGDAPLEFRNLTWNAATLSDTGGVTIPAGGTLLAATSGQKRLEDGVTFTLDGDGAVTGSQGIDSVATAGTPATFVIGPTGRLDLQSNAGFSDGFSGSNPSFAAATLEVNGVLRKSVASGTSIIDDNWTVHHAGSIEVESGALRLDGPVSGAGDFPGAGKVVFADDYSPGESPTEISFGGDMQLLSTASLQIEIGGEIPGADFDRLGVAGSVQLAGMLDIELIDSYQPELGDRFEIISAGASLSGSFLLGLSHLPELANELLGWSLEYGEQSLELVVAPFSYAEADFNEDGFVDRNDLSAWEANFGTVASATKATGDANSDGNVNGRDALAWLRQYTSSPAEGLAAVTVPEPNSLALCLGMVLLGGGVRITPAHRRGSTCAATRYRRVNPEKTRG